jgi:hypothetical protein
VTHRRTKAAQNPSSSRTVCLSLAALLRLHSFRGEGAKQAGCGWLVVVVVVVVVV